MQMQVLNPSPAQKLGAITALSQAQRVAALVLEVSKEVSLWGQEDPGMMS